MTEDRSAKDDCSPESRRSNPHVPTRPARRVPGHMQLQRRHAAQGIAVASNERSIPSFPFAKRRFLTRGMHLSTFFSPSLMARPASKLDVNCQTARAGCVCCHVRPAIGRVYPLSSLQNVTSVRSTGPLFGEAPLQVCGSISPKVEPQLAIATPLDDDGRAQLVWSRSALLF
ncbi:hypothetical protein BDP81DRAFT_218139 [Colletotrichum phormii]|uniref:Uncharacterized protein n=1 Tax=Colletotrichum phormii TaxID=359342 RepID=A0AAI9ZRZ3_9PEZI|nr:uncharacterized protein BDP81DRAFT_218139 [Colletotrichum phormii]KAK1637069.1 hypothetical protein BDP81DRAFT_218139 [Colletotrichum phormii]